MLVIKSPNISLREDLETLRRDPLLSGDNDGVRFLFDLGFPWCFPGGAPANGAAIRDISEHGDAEFVKAASQTIGYTGGGFDFSTMSQSTANTDEENHIIAPNDVWDSIASGAQYFLWVGYFKLPTNGDWNTDSTQYPMFCSSAAGYQSVADPLTVMQNTTSGDHLLQFRRQTAINTVQTTSVNVAGHEGQVVQAAFWRNASGRGARVRSELGGVALATGTSGSDNEVDFTGTRPRFGSVAPFTDYSKAAHRKARNYRLYRGFIEDLEISGRDPVAVIDADYARTIARGVFS